MQDNTDPQPQSDPSPPLGVIGPRDEISDALDAIGREDVRKFLELCHGAAIECDLDFTPTLTIKKDKGFSISLKVTPAKGDEQLQLI